MMPKWSHVDDVKLVKSQLGDRGKFPNSMYRASVFPSSTCQTQNSAFTEFSIYRTAHSHSFWPSLIPPPVRSKRQSRRLGFGFL